MVKKRRNGLNHKPLIDDKPIPVVAIKAAIELSNGMYAVVTGVDRNAMVDADVYRDKTMKELVSTQHGIRISRLDADIETSTKIVAMFLESTIGEFE